MIKTTLLATLAGLIILGSNNSDNNKMNLPTTDTQTKKENTSGYAPVNGLKMYYEIHGSGTPLVLIHGGGSTIQTTFGWGVT